MIFIELIVYHQNCKKFFCFLCEYVRMKARFLLVFMLIAIAVCNGQDRAAVFNFLKIMPPANIISTKAATLSVR